MTAPTLSPAPWTVRPDRTIADAGGVPLMRGYAERNFEANGPCAAAAPELYEALVHTLSLARLKWGNLDADANGIFSGADAALAKARG